MNTILRRSIIALPPILAAFVTLPAAHAAPAQNPEASAAKIFYGTQELQGLLSVHVDKPGGRILITLPAAAADGVAGRFLYSTALRTGLGAAPTFLDRGRVGKTQILAFRR
ncbi:MAG: hypothetical protein KGK05_03035, partial [Xanthomonadaceae bacterium]|nr:hypothetical protein [Xanthomonadaceae bacterium]